MAEREKYMKVKFFNGETKDIYDVYVEVSRPNIRTKNLNYYFSVRGLFFHGDTGSKSCTIKTFLNCDDAFSLYDDLKKRLQEEERESTINS